MTGRRRALHETCCQAIRHSGNALCPQAKWARRSSCGHRHERRSRRLREHSARTARPAPRARCADARRACRSPVSPMDPVRVATELKLRQPIVKGAIVGSVSAKPALLNPPLYEWSRYEFISVDRPELADSINSADKWKPSCMWWTRMRPHSCPAARQTHAIRRHRNSCRYDRRRALALAISQGGHAGTDLASGLRRRTRVTQHLLARTIELRLRQPSAARK